jgi:hypothetical protein
MRSLYAGRSRLNSFSKVICLTSDKKIIVILFLCAKREPGL